MNLRPILYVIGILLSILALSMALPMITDLHAGHSDWRVFFICILITSFFGGMLILTNATDIIKINTRQGFLLTTLSWTTISLFGALPLWLSELELSFTDALFESTSGITTTGATVIAGLDEAPPGLLLWRAMLQWLGGIGFIVMALSLLPFLNVGGMQLFRTESSENEKVMPRAAQMATTIAIIYIALTALCILCYTAAGFSSFDAIAHAFTTISTGGFSTYDTSFAGFDDYWREIVCIIFMIVGALPFVAYLRALNGDYGAIKKEPQVPWFFAILGASITVMLLWMCLIDGTPLNEAFLPVVFNLTSLMTGTGYGNADYSLWGPFAIALLFFLMVIGGCAGSTTCGIKIFRFQILYAISNAQIKKLLKPHGVFIPKYGNKPIPEDVPIAVLSFFFMYALSFAVLAIGLSATGLDFLTAMSAAAAGISNVGPGLGPIVGPTGNFASLTDPAKWMLSFGMILGRLELFTVMVLFAPRFWRR